MTVRLLVVTVAASDAVAIARATDELWRRGVTAVEERPVDDRLELRAVFGDAELDDACEQLADRFDVRIDVVDGKPGQQWRDHARPIVVSERLVVAPAWSRVEDGVATVWIEPSAAFGLGDHPTTRATLALLDETILARSSTDRVLDVGSGTGVLGIAALVLGAGSVRAIDVSGAAVEATRDNARRNDVSDRVVADQRGIVDLDGSYDVIVANLLAPILIDLADDLAGLLAPNGSLIVSGLLDVQETRVVDAFASLGVTARRRLDGWVALTLR